MVREVANKDVRRGPNGVTFSICRHVPSPSLYLRSSLVLSPVSPASALAFYCQLPPFFKGCNGESRAEEEEEGRRGTKSVPCVHMAGVMRKLLLPVN